VAVLQRSSFESILFCRAQCRGGVGGLAAIVFGSHPPQYHVAAGTADVNLFQAATRPRGPWEEGR
jgi:hypothetical protein